MHTTRRNLLKTAAVLLVDQWASAHTGAFGDPAHQRRTKDRGVCSVERFGNASALTTRPGRERLNQPACRSREK
jgi:hypothetical protein